MAKKPSIGFMGLSTVGRQLNLFGPSIGVGIYGPRKTERSNEGKISKPLRDQVWMKYMKNRTQGRCYCCRERPIHYTDFQVGHNKARAKGGKNHISNLRPICGPCNRGMRTMSIEKYRQINFGPIKPPKKKIRRKSRKRSPTGHDSILDRLDQAIGPLDGYKFNRKKKYL